MNRKNIVIIGAGPAGLFSAYKLSTENYNITIIDKGKDIYKRQCPVRNGKQCVNCNPCNIMCGFGGAGTFSDCKLSLSPYGVGGDIANYVTDPPTLMKYMQETMDTIEFLYSPAMKMPVIGANETAFNYIKDKLQTVGLNLTWCPTKHIGTDNTIQFMTNLYEHLKSKNVNFMFQEQVTDIELVNNKKRIILKSGKIVNLQDYVILAPGRSGSSWLCETANKLGLSSKSRGFDIGYRVELPAPVLEELTSNLYDMKISYTTTDGLNVRTFCTNPNGFVSEEHYSDGTVLANGHSYADKKSDNTNFAVLVHYPTLSTEDGHSIINKFYSYTENKLACFDWADLYDLSTDYLFNSNYQKTKQTLKTDFCSRQCMNALPKSFHIAVNIFLNCLNRLYPGVCSKQTNLYALEAKFYSNVIDVSNQFETQIKGLYCIGDGSGIARGIMQSACMGIIVADDINNKEQKRTCDIM